MKRRTGFVISAVAVLAAIVGCTETLAPAASPTGYTTSAELKLLNPTTGRLEVVSPEKMHTGVNASVVAGSNSKPAIVYASTDLGIAPTALKANNSYNDGKHTYRQVAFYRAGQPTASQYHLVDEKLIGITVNTWARTTTGGWYLAKSVISTISPAGATTGTYTTTGEYTQTTVPCNSAAPGGTKCPPAQMALSPSQRVVRTLAAAMIAASCKLSAQGGMCLKEWAYVASAWIGTVVGGATAETGAGIALAAGAYIGLGAATYDLEVCRHGKKPTGSGSGSNGSGGAAPGDTCDTGGPCLQIWTS